MRPLKHDIKYLIPAALAAALAFALAWGFKQRARAEEFYSAAGEYMGAVNAVYVRCANELADNITDMENELAKLRVAASRRQTVLALEDVVRSSAASVSVLSRLPCTHEAVDELIAFLVRTGDYARSLSSRALTGEALSALDTRQLESLYSRCSQLAYDLSAAVIGGELSFDVPAPSGYYADGGDQTGLIPTGDAADSAPQYPSLIYDGPFSESTEKAVPKCLLAEEAPEAEALEYACRLLNASLSYAGRSDGRIPVYSLEGELEDERAVSAAVAVNGCRLLWFMAESADAEGVAEPPDDEEYDRIINSAKAFLSLCGYEDMVPSYAQFYGGAALVSFVWEIDGVKVYNDLVKVWVDRSDLRVTGLDANNYLSSHCERRLPAPELTEEEARALASRELDIDAVSLALIPISPSVEALCYELHGYFGGGEYAVYVNAVTGAEERIFKIVSENGGKAAV